MEIKNLEKAASRIVKAVQNNERIILYGDSDMDGVASVVILQEAIEAIGGYVETVCFPNREVDGYGVNQKGLTFLQQKSPALLVTLDLGIGNVQEIDKANKMGFEVIVIDHHQPPQQLPAASIIIDPFQPGDESEFKVFCNAGITYLLAQAFVVKKMEEDFKNSLLELAALATIADMVPQKNQNQEIIKDGLRSLEKTKRLGLKAFFEILHREKKKEYVFQTIIAALNSAESQEFQNQSYVLLTSKDPKTCANIAQELLNKHYYKQEEVRRIVQEIDRRLLDKSDETIIFEGDLAWRLVLAGSAASILVNKYQKPAFIFKKMDNESAGSVRSIPGLDSVSAMRSCADLLITYGGHPMASGFRIKNENLEEFKKRLIAYFLEHQA